VRIPRILIGAVSAAALGSALVISAVSASPAAAPTAPRPYARTHLTAEFLAAARAAFVQELRKPDTAIFTNGTPTPNGHNGTTDADSYNWAGYADVSTTDGTFTKVSGSWTVPRVTCSTLEDSITSEWVGLDGFSDSTVEQVGTSSQCFEGSDLYYSWYEMYPAGVVEVGRFSDAGDGISASVTSSGSSFTLKLTDTQTNVNSFTQTGSCPTSTCLDTSAEWIAERPAYATTGIVPEAQFANPISFSSASETANGKTSTISGYSGTTYDLTSVDSTGTYRIVQTTGLSGGNAFGNIWRNSY